MTGIPGNTGTTKVGCEYPAGAIRCTYLSGGELHVYANPGTPLRALKTQAEAEFNAAAAHTMRIYAGGDLLAICNRRQTGHIEFYETGL